MRKRWKDGWFLGLLAATAALAFQVVSWAQCQVPNINTVACFTPGPNNPSAVTTCTNIPSAGVCSNSAIYQIYNFPNGTTPNKTGSTQQVLSNCYQYTQCAWVFPPITGKCATGTQYPGGGNWYQANMITTSNVKCPPAP
jgi:hypothetical protein